MVELIRDGRLVADDWQILAPATGELASSLPAGRLIVPLGLWRERHADLAARPDTGVWLASDEDPASLAGDCANLPVIAVHFPTPIDGRGYSIAARLRTRYRYRGELRAFGAVLRDQFDFLIRCGFDTLQPPAGRYRRSELVAALASRHTAPEPAPWIPQPTQFRHVAHNA